MTFALFFGLIFTCISLTFTAIIDMGSEGCCIQNTGSYVRVNHPEGNWTNITFSNRGHMIVVIDYITSDIIKYQEFDTHVYEFENSNNAAQDIELFLLANDALNQIIAIICRDQCYYDPSIYTRIVDIGCQIPKYRAPMVCLTMNKLDYMADWLQYKTLTGNHNGKLYDTFNIPDYPMPECVSYNIRSAGCCNNGLTYIDIVNDNIYYAMSDGHFIMTLDSRNGNIIDNITVDTYSDIQSINKINTYLNNDKRYGHLLIIATYNNSGYYNPTILNDIGCDINIASDNGYICVTINSQSTTKPWKWIVSEYNNNSIQLNVCVLYPINGGASISPTMNPTTITVAPTLMPTKKQKLSKSLQLAIIITVVIIVIILVAILLLYKCGISFLSKNIEQNMGMESVKNESNINEPEIYLPDIEGNANNITGDNVLNNEYSEEQIQVKNDQILGEIYQKNANDIRKYTAGEIPKNKFHTENDGEI